MASSKSKNKKTSIPSVQIIEFKDGFKWNVVPTDWAKKNFKSVEVYKIDEDNQSEALVESASDIKQNGVYAIEYKEANTKASSKYAKEIADLEEAINSPHTPEDQKVRMREILERLKSKDKTSKKPAPEPKKAPKTSKKAKAPKKTPKAAKGEFVPHDCDELLEKEKQAHEKRVEAAKKRAEEPKKTEATKNKETIAKASEKVENNITKRLEKNEVSKSEIEKLIKETEELLKKLKAALKQAK